MSQAGKVPQSEQALENALIEQLETLGYSYVSIPDEAALKSNLKTQLEKHNEITFSDAEFQQILHHLDKGNVFERAKTLRDKMCLTRDNGESFYLNFMEQDEWCQNEYQVTNQVTIEGSYKNRYDVTLLVNGLPLVQIELKRRGLELKEAFNQINRYQRHSFGASHGLFQYVQLFVISNGVNTKYYANNRKQSFKQTFYWADEDNHPIKRLDVFAKIFLEKCQVSKMMSKYIVLNETDKILMVLRPYQYYAVEAIVEKVKHSRKNGYIWHTTGSGKTLTSFKTAQILMDLPKVHKVMFVVDRKDLDYQTNKEFNSFSKGSVDGTNNTKALVNQLSGDTKLIVTTLQKLNTAISKSRYQKAMEPLKDKRIIFIFDECHRSQFGDTHKRINAFFNKPQMFGFTGTPIFADNVAKNQHGKRTTKDLFGDQLHKYVITDAIRDENVLKFSIEYVGRYKQKDGSQNSIDIEVEGVDTRELMESPYRLEKITDYIIANHARKTHSRDFTGMFCVSGVDVLTKYYDLFQAKKEAGEHKLRVATIFSYTANEDDKDADGLIEEIDPLDGLSEGRTVNKHTRDKLESYIADYNKMYGTKFSTKDSQSFYNYYNDIGKRVRAREVDILLVVNMFLTGFDSPPLNTMYVDKNLKHHGLLQAYSRTNRILNEKKSQGNIVCFRNLKKATDDAIALFSNKDAKETIIVAPYEDYVTHFNKAFSTLLGIAPTVDSVDALVTEDDELLFIKAFRELLRLRNVLTTFADFSFADLAMNEQSFNDYRSKYLDLYDKVKSNTQKEKVSILEDVDFELELIHRDEINVAYIMKLLAQLKGQDDDTATKQRKVILDLVAGDAHLRSKRKLIEKFILENLPKVTHADAVPEAFSEYWDEEKQAALATICEEENLNPERVETLINQHLFTEITPLRDEVVAAMVNKPKLLQRKTLAQRALDKIMGFVETFIIDAPD
ncbi:type I restriction enzyme, R subunit [Mariprofundus aestuarium]|uniref:Type I restriction enzyme endonuclease subunit n=1 Tax=Mariprofundus aestuarium TaxID=1921086 RepID=A0A2K8L0B1_MARES|nr:type I restriction endonuclease subunit R [Mariprofundus aestuarium]ATX80653.1 type I restriction enzyme, R subunit [Mariprofundus aestuarium]